MAFDSFDSVRKKPYVFCFCASDKITDKLRKKLSTRDKKSQ